MEKSQFKNEPNIKYFKFKILFQAKLQRISEILQAVPWVNMRQSDSSIVFETFLSNYIYSTVVLLFDYHFVVFGFVDNAVSCSGRYRLVVDVCIPPDTISHKVELCSLASLCELQV